MRLFALLLVIVAAAYALPSRIPKWKDHRSIGKIVGGENVTIEEYPYNCQINWLGIQMCGGSILSPEIVLTGAHCTDGAFLFYLTVRVGTSRRDEGGFKVGVAEFIQHPEFNYGTFDYDISILKLETPLTFGPTIQAVPLPYINQTWPVGSNATLTGWGTVSEDAVLASHDLLKATIPTVEFALCQQIYEQINPVTERMMCAGFMDGGYDSCSGDSGGPVVIEGLLAGIISWAHGCARPGYPGVNTDVGYMRTFIYDFGGL